MKVQEPLTGYLVSSTFVGTKGGGAGVVDFVLSDAIVAAETDRELEV